MSQEVFVTRSPPDAPAAEGVVDLESRMAAIGAVTAEGRLSKGRRGLPKEEHVLIHRLTAVGRGRLLIASLAALTVAFPATASATTTVYNNTFSGTNVNASWESSDPCGGYTQTYVFANTGKNKDSVTGHSAISTAVVYIN